MRCKVDENLPVEAAAILRAGGHECDTVRDEGLGGAADSLVYERCRRERRVLLTLDLDFSDIRAYPPHESPGIVVIRPAEPDRDRVIRLIHKTLAAVDRDDVTCALWIVEEDRIRIRRSGDTVI